MNLESFTGPGSTPSRRRFWDKVTQVVIASQKSSGKNVSVAEHQGMGTVINVNRGRSTTPSECDCPLPEGDCPHSLAISIKFDDTDTAQSTFLELSDEFETTGIIFYEFNAGGGNYKIGAFSLSSGEFVEFTIPEVSFFNVFHTLCATFIRVDDFTVSVFVTVDGMSDSFTMDNPSGLLTQIYVGSKASFGESHRTISCVKLLSNPDSDEEDFSFPPDSFDAFTAGASIVDGALRIDQVSGDSFATKNLDPGLTLACPCCGFSDCAGTAGIKYRTKVITIEWTADNPGGPTPCTDCTSSGSLTSTLQYDLSCSKLTITCSGTLTIHCSPDIDDTCSYELVDGACEVVGEQCSSAPFENFLLCANTATQTVNDCTGTVLTQTFTADEGTGTFTVTETVSDPVTCTPS